VSAGTYVVLFEENGQCRALPDAVSSMDAAVTLFLDTGRDQLVHLTTLSGCEYVTRASLINGWMISSPETREREVHFEKKAIDEDKANRVAAGLPWESDS
jgi:hypothetical protein